MSLAAKLAEFALNTAPDQTASEAQAVMRLSLYDWMVCGLVGAHEPVAQIVRSVAPDGGAHAVFGSEDTFGPAQAAWINGTTSHALDYDDTHFDHIGHPSVAVFPAAFAMGANGADTLRAALIGAELSVRIGAWLGRGHYEAGFHQTATAGAFGATCAAGRLLGLTQPQLQAALGVAATQAAGLKSQFGTMGKPYHAGLAARTGVEAALLAQAGFDTRGAGLDGPQGFGPTHYGAGDLSAFEGLGSHWRMTDVRHKFHACCHGLHAMLEALEQCDLPAPSDLDAIDVTTHPRWLRVCNIDAPKTGLETKFSYRHVAAMVVHGVPTAALDGYSDTHAQDVTLQKTRAKVRVHADADLAETEAHVRVSAGNDVIERRYDVSAPVTLTDKTDRLRRKGRALLGPQTEELLWTACIRDSGPNMDALTDLMVF